MKIPTDLQPGDVFHTNRGAMTFTRYAEWNGEKWADTKDYSFLVDTGIADPTEVEVIRIQRVNSSGMSECMQRETDMMCRQERCTKGRCAIELSHIIAQYERDDPSLIPAVIAYKDKILRESYA
jgi:hypothetical protein